MIKSADACLSSMKVNKIYVRNATIHVSNVQAPPHRIVSSAQPLPTEN